MSEREEEGWQRCPDLEQRSRKALRKTINAGSRQLTMDEELRVKALRGKFTEVRLVVGRLLPTTARLLTIYALLNYAEDIAAEELESSLRLVTKQIVTGVEGQQEVHDHEQAG